MKTQKKGELFELVIPDKWKNVTIETILRNHWQAPKKLIHSMRMEGDIKVNGESISWTQPLSQGDTLQLHLFKEVEYDVPPTYGEIDVLFEDDHLIVVNKPAGIDTHPNHPNETDSLANLVAFHYQAQGESSRVQHIHRLDHDTSGAIIFAKHPLSKAILDRLLTERQIKRTYHALVHGRLKQKKGTISEPIGRDRHHNTRRRVSPSGQGAVTHYKVLEDRNSYTLVEVQLDTGRTHQIRVHMSHIGHPLVGDTLYGGKPVFKRQALHAAQISFPHPLTGDWIECEADCTDDVGL
ncbi:MULTISPECIES: RluA family pseudouridine synthase [Rossellomorea]|jgi:23S rRNA pseudouridine1911/1915/1917 synthase|uniref:RluA family pseudouridine synthase n=1 Tax=Rossellomorea TaxID=2837508 RepID=UPI0011E977D6|nr:MULTISPECIES: RluA family pseudouridine synthase [Rossellomorea]MDT9023376.1 RluA family pseudouridine synthase [Rossellomorea sp. YC4-1]TYS90630.1 RluA family pseudouridine synthase [Rossellomorea aquimaris]